jgi:hypothetical protein
VQAAYVEGDRGLRRFRSCVALYCVFFTFAIFAWSADALGPAEEALAADGWR